MFEKEQGWRKQRSNSTQLPPMWPRFWVPTYTKSGLSLLLVLFSALRVACCVSGSLVRVRGKLWRRSHHCARKSDLPETRTSKPAPRLLRRVFSTGTPVLPSPQKPTFKLSLQSGKCVELIHLQGEKFI